MFRKIMRWIIAFILVLLIYDFIFLAAFDFDINIDSIAEQAIPENSSITEFADQICQLASPQIDCDTIISRCTDDECRKQSQSLCDFGKSGICDQGLNSSELFSTYIKSQFNETMNSSIGGTAGPLLNYFTKPPNFWSRGLVILILSILLFVIGGSVYACKKLGKTLISSSIFIFIFWGLVKYSSTRTLSETGIMAKAAPIILQIFQSAISQKTITIAIVILLLGIGFEVGAMLIRKHTSRLVRQGQTE
ncbi:MAG: hypothetical protein ACI8Y7_000497 [Candidatus Woesearchaeota archaeon]|jgi:hypothetical protein